MRRPNIVASGLIVAMVAIGGVTVINAKSLKPVATERTFNAVSVLQMMIDAKNLPEERYDAF